jgi:glycosyltransferase involved in cell wall biosynthesis
VIKNQPLVSVIMPVYNCELYIKESIDSILNQSYKNIELIIIDDGSKDKSSDIVTSYEDKRIKFIKNKNNKGVSATRNVGLKTAEGKYVAIMDADDISSLKRIEKQVKFLEENDEYGLIGGHYVRFEVKPFLNKKKLIKHSLISEQNRVKINFLGSFASSTVMMKNCLIIKHKLFFDTKLKVAEDFDFWRRIGKYSKVTNIDEILLYYRYHSNNTMKTNKVPSQHTIKAIRKSLNDLGIKNNDIFRNDTQLIKDIKSFFILVERLEDYIRVNKKTNLFNQRYLTDEIHELIFSLFKRNIRNLGFSLYFEFKNTVYFRKINFRLKYKIFLIRLKYFLKV